VIRERVVVGGGGGPQTGQKGGRVKQGWGGRVGVVVEFRGAEEVGGGKDVEFP
jgi:hypothetical protein